MRCTIIISCTHKHTQCFKYSLLSQIEFITISNVRRAIFSVLLRIVNGANYVSLLLLPTSHFCLADYPVIIRTLS